MFLIIFPRLSFIYGLMFALMSLLGLMFLLAAYKYSPFFIAIALNRYHKIYYMLCTGIIVLFPYRRIIYILRALFKAVYTIAIVDIKLYELKYLT